jgi:eukaryotic-like serine/threonine-protein kinase
MADEQTYPAMVPPFRGACEGSGVASSGDAKTSKLPRPGDLIDNKYRVEKLLGQGGMGAVFAAHHEVLQERVAIKLLLADVADNPEAVARFVNEARAATRIQNDHVARVRDVGTHEGTAYMVLEYLEGADLAELLRVHGPRPVVEVVDCVLQSLEAIAQAHALGIVHRDLKPANLYLAHRQDGSSCVKVLDFGISKAAPNALLTPSSGVRTSTTAMLGSPYYMSPEQIRSSKSVDTRTDIWSLGIVMYELLVGNPPFTGETLGELMVAILERDALPIRSVRGDVSPELEAVVNGCLRRDPAQRFQTVGDLASALAPFATPAGQLSIERIRRAVASLGAVLSTNPEVRTTGAGRGAFPPGAVGASTAANPAPVGRQTAAAWGQASAAGSPPVARNAIVIGAALAFVVTVLVGGGAAWFLLRRPASVATVVPASSADLPKALAAAAPSTTPSEPPPSVAALASAQPIDPGATSSASASPPPQPSPSASAAPQPGAVASVGAPGRKVVGPKGTPAVPAVGGVAPPPKAAQPATRSTYDPSNDSRR